MVPRTYIGGSQPSVTPPSGDLTLLASRDIHTRVLNAHTETHTYTQIQNIVNIFKSQAWWRMTLIPKFRRQKQAALLEFEARLST